VKRNDGVVAKIRQVPKNLSQPKSEKLSQNVILQKVLTGFAHKGEREARSPKD